jgi:hypothetical protein
VGGGSARPALKDRGEGNSGRKGGAEGPERAETFTKSRSIDRRGERGRFESERGRGARVDRSRRAVKGDHRPGVGRGRIPAAHVSMKCRAVAGMTQLDRTGGRQDPVPVENRDVFCLASVGMPAEEVVVMLADLPGLVMMPDVVEIGLGPGRVDQAEDQQGDPQTLGSMMMVKPPLHRSA